MCLRRNQHLCAVIFLDMPIRTGGKLKEYLGYKIFFAVNAALLGLLVFGVGREYIRGVSIERELRELEEARDAETANRDSLVSAREYLESQEFVEAEAREKFGLSRSGETLVVVDESQKATAPAEEISPTNFMLWYWYFFDKDKLTQSRVL